MQDRSIIALIPARSGSQRVADKNIKQLFGNPLFYYTIEQAKQSGIFTDIWFSSDSMDYLHMAEKHDVKTIHRKFPTQNNSPDIDWIQDALSHIEKFYKRSDYYAILRPTSPFRKASTIKRAWEMLRDNPDFDSLKAVIQCPVTPYKIFEVIKHDDYRDRLVPLLNDFPKAFTYPTGVIAHRNFAAQVGFLDICKWDNSEKHDTHFGEMILPFTVNSIEAWDINTELDWFIAEELIKSGRVTLTQSK